MGRAQPDPRRASTLTVASRYTAFVDAEGRPTDDPGVAVRGEIAEFDDHGRLRRRTHFFLAERGLAWPPVSEPALLLWALVSLMVIWLAIGFVLRIV